MSTSTHIYGIRAISEALESDQHIQKLYIQQQMDGVLLREIISKANKENITISYVPKEKIGHMAKGGNHQGVVATLSPIDFADLEEVLERTDLSTQPTFLLLDGITDVRNLGAIIRTAECTGVTAVVLPSKGNAPINSATIKTSAGAAFQLPICKVGHIKDAIFLMQSYGIKIAGATEKVEEALYAQDLNTPLALVMGNEEKGIQPSVLKMLDYKLKLPLLGDIASLNVSVACGAILYEVVRQKGKYQN